MPPVPIRFDGLSLDLSGRLYHSTAVAASPSAATETTICTVTIAQSIAVTKAVYLVGWFAVTIGTSGVSATVKLRQTDTSGTTIAATGAQTVTAANLYSWAIQGVDASPTLPGQVYVMTLTVGSGAAASTVSAANLVAFVV